jgi:hypothetical protein
MNYSAYLVAEYVERHSMKCIIDLVTQDANRSLLLRAVNSHIPVAQPQMIESISVPVQRTRGRACMCGRAARSRSSLLI